jgi:aminoglycoside phosphotransferase (APT) family kinase protein
VVRRTGSSVFDSLTRAVEFHVQLAAWRAGVRTPEPLAAGATWVAMRHHPGSTAPADAFAADQELLAEALADCLAAIHRVSGPIAGLAPPPDDPPAATVAALYRCLDQRGEVRPALEWGLARLAAALPDTVPPVLCHGDFRIGNVLIDAGRFESVLDWEFAGWNDPAADIGWLCVRHWRRGRVQEASGVTSAADFLDRYRRHGGPALEPARVRWWQLAGTIRWALIALAQADRFARGEDPSIDRAITGRRLPEIEVEILRLSDSLGAVGRRFPPPTAPLLRVVGDLPAAGTDDGVFGQILATDDSLEARRSWCSDQGWCALARAIRTGASGWEQRQAIQRDTDHRHARATAAGLV